MSQKDLQKKREPLIEEDKDFYLAFLNKKLRNNRKKLEQIEELMKRDQKTLKAEQREKINSKADVIQTIQHNEDLKDIYYNAYKIALEEGKVQPKERSTDRTETDDKETEPSKAGKPAESVPAVVETDTQTKDEIVKDTLRKVLNLITFSQVFGNQATRDDFYKACEQKGEELNKEEVPQADEVQQFYKTVFNFTEGQDSTTIEEKFNNSLDKLTQFVKAEDQTAFSDKTYKNLSEIVEKTTTTASFKHSNLNIETIQKALETQEEVKPQEQTQPQNVAETQKEQAPEPSNEVQVVQEVEEPLELPPGAAFLKPDIDDFSKSPEKGRFLPKEPKLIKFVDEIERELISTQARERSVNMQSPQNNEEDKSVSKEAGEQDTKVVNGVETKEEEREHSGEKPEQKGYKTRRYNNEYGPNKGRYNDTNGNGKKYQNNRGYDNRQNNTQKRPATNYKDNKYTNGGQRSYGKAGYGEGKYQYQYVEKRQQNED